MRHFPTASVAKSISDNLDFLKSSSRDVSAQHSSLRAVFNHSWNLLPEGERQVLRKLSVFRGGWDEDAAEKIAGASVYSLLSLVDKSLVRREASGRFNMHEMVRQYAAEQLQAVPGEQNDTQAAHAAYFVGLAEQAEARLYGPEQNDLLERLEREHNNLRAAIRWATGMGKGVDTGSPLGRPKRSPGSVSGGQPGGGGPESYCRHRDCSADHRGLVAVLGHARARQRRSRAVGGDVVANGSGGLFARGMALDPFRAKALNGAGTLARRQGDYASARSLHEESLAIYRRLGDKAGVSNTLGSLGLVAHRQGDYAAARALYEESLAIERELGNKKGISAALGNLGNVAHEQRDYASARRCRRRSPWLRTEPGRPS